MPEFQMDHGTAAATKRFNKLDSFTQGYVEAAFWLLDEECTRRTLADLMVASLRKMASDCAAFQKENKSLLDLAYGNDEYDEHRAGVDFWLTRNGHGAGFWDRGELEIIIGQHDETTIGKVLTDRAHVYGSADLYQGDNGRLYYS